MSWHWRVMQYLKKNWLVVWKMTYRLWFIFMKAVASLQLALGWACVVKAYKVLDEKVRKSYVSWHKEELYLMKSDPQKY